MTRTFARWISALGGAFAVGLAAAPPAGAADEAGVVSEVLSILRDRGIVDEEQYSDLVMKNSAYEKKDSSIFGRIEWSGDLRLRHESFWYDEDANGDEKDNRYRTRYRLRLGGKVPINEKITAGFRIASGENDHRSTNRSLGKDDDFGPDDLFIDRAYLELEPFSKDTLNGGSLKLIGGKVSNPFTWKRGKDFLLWDGDINPEGVGIKYRTEIDESLSAFANAGYFIIDEESGAKDPHVLGLQGGLEFEASDEISLGGRATWYNFRSLDASFIDRNASDAGCPGGPDEGLGNTCDGLAGSDNEISVGELYGYLGYDGVEDWPMLFYGTYVQNFDAESSVLFPEVGEEDTAWGAGFEFGNKKKFAKLGLGYWHVEANAWPALYTDSDLFDGKTNREGWAFYGARQLWSHTDLKFQLFVGEEMEDDFGFNVGDADRVRLQTDLVVKF